MVRARSRVRSPVLAPVSKSEEFFRRRFARREAPRRGEWDFRALRARDGGSEKYISEIFGGRILRRSANLYVRLPHPPVRTHQSLSFLGNIVKR
jgi:hypothetical protein